MKKYTHYLALCLSIIAVSCQLGKEKDLKISGLFSDHMVLQQNHELEIAGEYAPGQKVTLSASWGPELFCTADADGNWTMKMNTPKAGGPYTISIETTDSILIISDVLIGEVWLASGQSNMQMPLMGWPPNDTIMNSAQEIANADYPEIRMLTVAMNLSGHPLDTIGGEWQVSSPETAGHFSATAYFFAKNLYNELKVPIGIISTNWGGTVAEAWTSKESLRELGDFDEAIAVLDQPELENQTEAWFEKWPTCQIPVETEEWQNITFSDLAAAEAEFDDSKWSALDLPGRFDQIGDGDFDGAVWLRKKIDLQDISEEYTIRIRAVDDMDAIFFNGKKVGGLAGPGFYNILREVTIPKDLLKKGENLIAIRAIDTGGPGSVSGPMTISSGKGEEISLEGSWKSQVVAEIFSGNCYVYDIQSDMSERPAVYQLNPNQPTVLYNAMIHPLVPYPIAGAIWYQGEANVGRAEQYKQLFPAMIADWRGKWGYDFPFYFVQIAPFIYNSNPDEQVSQELRDAQRYSLKTPKTGMVVTMDIGNPINIHPANKPDVGKRLARLALANDYGKDLIPSGPLYKSTTKSGSKLLVEFDFTGSGLAASPKGLAEFEIAGADMVYHPAKARIVDNKVEVYSPAVTSPEFVRYAWKDDSEATLFNKEGLPASTFTSENW